MNILLSNDDGISAAGINILAEHLKAEHSVDVFAPDRNRSGASNSLTLEAPLRLKEIKENFFSIEGTPTDCVHLALRGYLKKKIDIVVSGINEGANLGDDVFYSGTIAAAMEGRHLGLPAIAVSLVGDENYETAARVVSKILKNFSKNFLPSQTILNINVPDIAYAEIKGIEVTRLGTRHKGDKMIEQDDPRGKKVYWIGPPGMEADAGAGTDFFAIKRNCVSITPLQIDLTNYGLFDNLASWLKTNKIFHEQI